MISNMFSIKNDQPSKIRPVSESNLFVPELIFSPSTVSSTFSDSCKTDTALETESEIKSISHASENEQDIKSTSLLNSISSEKCFQKENVETATTEEIDLRKATQNKVGMISTMFSIKNDQPSKIKPVSESNLFVPELIFSPSTVSSTFSDSCKTDTALETESDIKSISHVSENEQDIKSTSLLNSISSEKCFQKENIGRTLTNAWNVNTNEDLVARFMSAIKKLQSSKDAPLSETSPACENKPEIESTPCSNTALKKNKRRKRKAIKKQLETVSTSEIDGLSVKLNEVAITCNLPSIEKCQTPTVTPLSETATACEHELEVKSTLCSNSALKKKKRRKKKTAKKQVETAPTSETDVPKIKQEEVGMIYDFLPNNIFPDPSETDTAPETELQIKLCSNSVKKKNNSKKKKANKKQVKIN